jgi:UDP-N-acetylmuramyl tripeptide synthase
VVSNSGGANLPAGLVTALAADRTSRLGVLEVDEPYLPRVVDAVAPQVAVLMNLTRDQLDRNAEVRRVAARWREATPRVPVVVANADDPLVVWAAQAAPTVRWVAAGLAWRYDAVACPACGGLIRVAGGLEGSAASAPWRCERCGFARPDPSWSLAGEELCGPAPGDRWQLSLGLPGPANRGNAALAVAAAHEFGVSVEEGIEALGGVSTVEGRYLTTAFAGRPVRLLLAKNPAGWQEALGLVRPPPAGLVVAVNARIADGRDPAWLWDVPFEVLAGRRVVAAGERARDVAVRLRYAGVQHIRVDDLGQALRTADGAGPVEAVANYTAFQHLRAVVGGCRGAG